MPNTCDVIIVLISHVDRRNKVDLYVILASQYYTLSHIHHTDFTPETKM